MNLDELQLDLCKQFPEYSFKLGNRIYGKCLIAKKNKFSGADIFLKNNTFIIEAAIPEMKTRILIGSGALLLKFIKKDYNEPCLRIFEYLNSKNISIQVKN